MLCDSADRKFLFCRCLVMPTLRWSLLWVPDINGSHKNTLDPWGNGGCCSACVIRADAACRAVLWRQVHPLPRCRVLTMYTDLFNEQRMAEGHRLVRLCMPVMPNSFRRPLNLLHVERRMNQGDTGHDLLGLWARHAQR